jgi:hypothetical protein
MKYIVNPAKGAKIDKYPKGDVYQWFGENPDLYYKSMGLNGHNGIDIAKPKGTPILATAGTICEVKNNPSGYGKYVRILTYPDENGDFLEITYGHLDEIYCYLGQRVKDGDIIGTMGNCFDKETEILTEDGWKKFSELNKKEKVATLNPETNEIEYHLPYAYTKKKVKEMWYFRNYHSLDFAVTGDHTMYVEKQDGKMHFINFEDLPNFSWVKQSGGIWRGVEVEKYHIPKIEMDVNQTSKKRIVEGFDVDMDDWLAFLGWWITDGCVSREYDIRITQSFNNPEKREIIENILDKLPFNVYRHREDYVINSKQLNQHLRQIAPNKQIPSFIKNLSPRQIRIFLDAFWGGNGWQHKSTKYYITPSKSVADDLQELIMKCGGYAVIKMCDPLKINRTKPAMIGGQIVISKKPYYLITEGKHRMGMIKKEMAQKLEYNDYAYCLSVKNHIIYVRRNGRPMWCGNTGFIISGNTPYWGNAPANTGVHLHLGCRECSTQDTGWFSQYSTGQKAFIKNYLNGFKGGVDPLPFIENWFKMQVSTLQKLIELYQKLLNLLKK